MTIEPTALEKLNRDELIAKARQLGANRPELLTRPELRDEIIRLSECDENERRRARGWFGVARDLVASVVNQGLNLPDTVELIRGVTAFNPRTSPPVATVTLAEIYAAQGHVRKSLDLLDEVLAKEPDHEAARLARARLANEISAAVKSSSSEVERGQSAEEPSGVDGKESENPPPSGQDGAIEEGCLSQTPEVSQRDSGGGREASATLDEFATAATVFVARPDGTAAPPVPAPVAVAQDRLDPGTAGGEPCVESGASAQEGPLAGEPVEPEMAAESPRVEGVTEASRADQRPDEELPGASTGSGAGPAAGDATAAVAVAAYDTSTTSLAQKLAAGEISVAVAARPAIRLEFLDDSSHALVVEDARVGADESEPVPMGEAAVPRERAEPGPDRILVVRTGTEALSCCWHVGPETLERMQSREPSGCLALRVVEVAPSWEGPVAHDSDTELAETKGHRSVRLTEPRAEFRVALGWRCEQRFSVLAVGAEFEWDRERGALLRWAPPTALQRESLQRIGAAAVAEMMQAVEAA